MKLQAKTNRLALRVSMIYGLVGGVWCLLSDRVLAALVSDPAAIIRIDIIKDWTFVAATALVLFLALRIQLRRWEQTAAANRQSQEKLRESEGHYSSLFDNMLNGFAYCQMHYDKDRPQDFTYLDVNPAFEALTGLKNVQGRKATEVMPGIREADPALLERYGRVARTGVPERFEIYVEVLKAWYAIAVYSPRKDHFVAVFDVITERKLAEEMMRQSETEFRTLAEAMPQIVWMTRPDGWNIYFNQQWVDYTGLTMEESHGHGWNKPFHPDDQKRAWDAWQAATTTLAKYSIECRLRRADGEYRWWLIRGVPLKDDDGKVLKWFGTCTDIHKSKEAEEKLKLFRELIERSSDGIHVADPVTGRFLDANEAGCRDLGYTRDELLALTVFDITTGLDRAVYDTTNAQMKKAGHATREALHRRKDGTTFPVEVSLSIVSLDRDYLLAVMRNITERKQAELALRESQALYHSLVDQMPAGIFRKDAEGRYVFVSSWFCKFKGVNPELFLGRTPQEVITIQLAAGDSNPAQIKQLAAQGVDHHQQIMRTGKSIELVEEYALADGRKQFVHAVKIPVIDRDGKIIGTQGILFDITESRLAATALRESQALYHSLVDQMPAGIFRKDAEGRYVFVNPWFCRLKGMTPERLLGKTSLEIGLKDTVLAATGAGHHQQIMQTGRQIEVEEHGVGPDGKEQHIHVVKSPILDSDGKIMGTQGILFDVTARLQAEDELRRTNAFLDSIIENIPNMLFLKDARTLQFVRFNRAGLNLLGCSKDDLLGKTDYDFFKDRKMADWFTEKDRQVLRGKEVVDIPEETVQTRDWGQRILHTKKVPILNAKGEPEYLLGISEDITERKKAEESHKQLATAVEQAAETIVITDIQGTILYVNPAFDKSTGYTRAEVLGKNTRVLKSGRQDAVFYHRMWETLGRGEAWNGHFVNRRKDGTFYEEEATISPVRDDTGRVVNYVAVKRDVTREVQLETQFRQSQKMEAVGKLAGGVAHDFNNILAVIQMQADMLKTDGNPAPTQLEFANDIIKAVQRASALTRQLLLFSRKQTLQLRDLDLNESINELTKMLRRTLGEDIELQFKFAMEPLFIHADAGMLDQVLMNLAVNARDAMPKGGRLVIKTSAVEFDESVRIKNAQAQPGSFVCLSVCDTGMGIPPEILPRIFEPFFTTKEAGKGTGLGLATVFGIAQQHQGWINVYSEVGKGTTFRIYLPRLAGMAGQKPEPSTLTAMRGGNETILLVEDDAFVRAVVRSILTKLGYRVLEAINGVEGLELWKQRRDDIRLLLTDLVMPGGINGRELGGQLLRENPRLKVIYASGYSAEVIGQDFPVEEGVNFLTKPFEAHKLAQTVRNSLDKN